ncbi:MAG: GNAT family N-acetyltransferase [Holdemania massiliensis]
MLELRPLTTADGEAAYMFLQAFAPDENGFENPYHDCSKETFLTQELPLILDHAQGRNLKENYVPETWYFLWDDDQMVGLFRIRHYLTEALAQGQAISVTAFIRITAAGLRDARFGAGRQKRRN